MTISFQVLIALASLLAVALAADVHAPSYHAPVHEPSYHPAPYKEPEYGPPHYEYKYGVDAEDPYYGKVYFGANEARDGYSTYGEYRVLLPDGRTQIVSYNTADAYSGNVMDVKYEGKASYAPVHAPVHGKGYHPEPIHKPIVHKPVYHAEPIHKAPIYHA